MQAEMKRIEAGVKMEPLDVTRMSIEPPRLHEQDSLEAWKKCVNNASSQLEHQHHRCAHHLTVLGTNDCPAVQRRDLSFTCRVQNFKLAVKYAPAVWKAHNARTDVYMKKADSKLKEVKDEITKVNQRRKLQQEKEKLTLDRLSKEYQDLVQNNIKLAVACKKLELDKENKQQSASPAPGSTTEGQVVAAEEIDSLAMEQ